MTSLLSSLLLGCLLLSGVDGSSIMFNSSSSFVKPLVSSNLTLTCKIQDTAPVGPIIGKRSIRHVVINDVKGDMKREDLPSDDVTRPGDLSNLDDRQMTKKSVTHTDDDVQFVTSILVTRNGVDIASLSEHFGVKQLSPDVIVTGHLTAGRGERGMLQITWSHPTQAEAGIYTCDVITLSAQAHGVTFSQTINITEAEVTMNDLVSEFHRMKLEKEKMEKTISELKNDNSAMNKTIETLSLTDQSLTNTINKLDQTLTNKLDLTDQTLTSQITSVNRSLTSLRDVARVEPDVFFSAILTSSKAVSQNQVLIFDQIVTSEGHGYDSHTGVFTAPLAGFYLFNIHAVSEGTKVFRLGLLHNGSRVIDVNKEGDEYYSAVSNSVLLELGKNDQVKVISWAGTSYVDGDWKSSTFSGRLVSLV